jgi:hypothetical protein
MGRWPVYARMRIPRIARVCRANAPIQTLRIVASDE